jgi:hypothetical protein
MDISNDDVLEECLRQTIGNIGPKFLVEPSLTLAFDCEGLLVDEVLRFLRNSLDGSHAIDSRSGAHCRFKSLDALLVEL